MADFDQYHRWESQIRKIKLPHWMSYRSSTSTSIRLSHLLMTRWGRWELTS